MTEVVRVLGQVPDASAVYFAPRWEDRPHDFSELAKLAEFPALRTVSFHDSEIDDAGVAALCRATQIDNLTLQGCKMRNEGLRPLERLTNLEHLRLKDNRQLDNGCIDFLLPLRRLESLGVHETSITQAGLDRLHSLESLALLVIDLWEGNFEYDALVALSRRMPKCEILAKGRGAFEDGVFDGEWGRD